MSAFSQLGRQPAPAKSQAVPFSGPRLLDYLLILCGCCLSLMLAEMGGWKAVPAAESAPVLLLTFVKIFPHTLFLPLGILLLWPAFYGVQRIFGRPQALTAGEWLWGLAWLGTLLLVTWITWKALGTPPGFLGSPGFQKGVAVGYVILAVSMAGIALVIALVDLVRRSPQPWTHSFSLILLIWPVVPLASLWLWNIKLE